MMGRLIDIDRLCNDLAKRWSIADKKKEDIIRAVMADVVTPIVVSQPTVDAVPVRHGRWIRVYSRPGVFKYLGWTCDQCGQRTGNEYAPQWYKFCPNCGALMDERDGDGNG